MLTECVKTCANPRCPLGTQPVSNFYLDKRRKGYRATCRWCCVHKEKSAKREMNFVPTGKMKRCTLCQVAKDEAYFSGRGNGKLRGYCKTCRNARDRGIVIQPVKPVEDIVRESGLKVLRETRACDAMTKYFGW